MPEKRPEHIRVLIGSHPVETTELKEAPQRARIHGHCAIEEGVVADADRRSAGIVQRELTGISRGRARLGAKWADEHACKC